MSKKSYRILIVAGEASGDLHGSHLVEALNLLHPDSRFFGMGGKKMRSEGVDTFFDIERMGAVGAIEILGELPLYIKVYRKLAAEISSGSYDAAILIDYPTLNLRLAKLCKRANVPVFYFISPQIWAWRKGRIKQIRETVNRMFVVLPFEESLYLDAGVDAEFLGHPFADKVFPSMEKEVACKEFRLDSGKKIIGLLPGSRKNEIQSLLQVMVEAAEKIQKELSNCQFVLPIADSIDPEMIRQKLNGNPLDIRLVTGKTYDVMNCCDFVIIASGSATLEAGILGCPMVIVYKLNPITYYLARILIDTEMIGLVNIVAGEPVAAELIQGEANAENIKQEAVDLLNNPERLKAVKSRLLKIRESLGEPGVMKRVAESICQYLDQPAGHEKISQ
ncbi:MAG: lipid-A-disaccharide synthase [Nitrospinaceae bacterium]|nr:MAG: lipid-A-disaccharide synthase [Nitrospinaceae bacterium]